jgi:hypothetical protein
VLPKSLLGQAVTYATNQWTALNVYLTDGDLAIDNNAAERALRQVAVGRKNWLFFGSDAGGATAAVLASLTETCRRHAINPWTYLCEVLTVLPTMPTDRLAELLPDHWAAAKPTPDSSPFTIGKIRRMHSTWRSEELTRPTPRTASPVGALWLALHA